MDNPQEHQQNPDHSMAVHEMEMQRQMMSIPPIMDFPPPGVLPPPGMPPPNIHQLPPPLTNMSEPPPGQVAPVQQMSMPPIPPPHLLVDEQQLDQIQQQLQQSTWPEDSAVDNNSGGGNADHLPSLMSMKVDKPDEMKNKITGDVVLPKALEDVFAFKDQLAGELGRKDGEIPSDERSATATVARSTGTTGVISTDYADADDADSDDEDGTAGQDDDDDDGGGQTMNAASAAASATTNGNAASESGGGPVAADAKVRLDKNKKKKKRKKTNRQRRQQMAAAVTVAPAAAAAASEDKSAASAKPTDGDVDLAPGTEPVPPAINADDVTIEYVPDKITVAELAPMYRQFYRVFEIFKHEDKSNVPKDSVVSAEEKMAALKKEKEKLIEEEDEEYEDERRDDKEKLSKRKLKKLTRLSVAELKQLVQRPDVVEMHDVTARDPKLLVQLKAHRNTVQVPRHWCFKRKYLQGKRGIEKPPFDLPAFIKKTGIMEMRASLQEKDEAKTLKAKMRERARPKMGKIDIDYQKLHDAFFKWQTKPRMTIHGDLYYEGKEFETRLKEKKPGDLSEELRTALGMPIGPNCHKIPPPWLIAQQRYGPPPSYPNLKIPGLNAPIPEGTSFGYHAGGWGKPPVDEKGKPLYGDVFGTNSIDPDSGVDEGDIDRNMWGELESESEESSSEEEEEGEDLGNAIDESGLVTPAEGLVTPSGLTSGVPPGMETPDTIELRKKKIENEMEDNETPVLYQVLPEKRTDRIGASMMGSTHVYDMSTAGGKPPQNLAATHRTAQQVDREGMVELALDPSELDMDNDAMAQRYEQQMREQQSHLQKEDLSDMLAEHVARQKSKRKRQQGGDATSKQNKKYKEFKF